MEAATAITQQLHGYTKHIIPQLNEQLHPYLSPKKQKTVGMYRSFDDMLVSGIKAKLMDADNSVALKIEGLLILNEKASTQETKMEMIFEGLLQVAIDLIDAEESMLSYECMRLVGSLCSVKAGRDKLPTDFNTKVTVLLKTQDQRLFEVVGWALSRIAAGRDGTDYLIANGFMGTITRSMQASIDNTQLLERMLLVLGELVQCDDGIAAFCVSGVFSDFLGVIRAYNNKSEARVYPLEVVKRVVEVLSCIAMHDVGRELLIQSSAIELLNPLLLEVDERLVNNCLRALMFATMSKRGKRQMIEHEEGEMVKRVIILLSRYFEIRDNGCEVLINVAEDHEGFLFVVNHLLSNPAELVRIFDCSAIRPLAILLERLTRDESILAAENLAKIEQITKVLLKLEETDKTKTYAYVCANTLNMIRHVLRCVVIETDGAKDHLIDFIAGLCAHNKRQNELLLQEHNEILLGNTFIDIEVYGNVVACHAVLIGF